MLLYIYIYTYTEIHKTKKKLWLRPGTLFAREESEAQMHRRRISVENRYNILISLEIVAVTPPV